MQVICTAGHVDHGKSALVRALTGMEPDRFAEEQRRGLTIDLGFAWARLGDPPRTLAFVDLPGHERFIANMLAGAGPVSAALLVVAADEGWMPQSQEHLEILDLLGVTHGVVAVTKTDLVDAETAELAVELVAEQLADTALARAPIVPVSAASGAGLDELVAALATLSDAVPASADEGRPRLWIDRSFSITGAGTVATGTLGGGALRVGEELAVLPDGRQGRIRGLQVLKETVREAEPGSRVAVNLTGVERSAVERGDALGRPGQWLAVTELEARVRVLPGRALSRRGAWHLHVGSGHRVARVVPLDAARITGQGWVRIEIGEPLPLAAGDRFVIREAGRWLTIAGGVIADARPPPRPRARQRAERLEALARRAKAIAGEDRAALLAEHVRERAADRRDHAAAAAGLDTAAAAEGARAHGLVDLADHWVDPAALEAWGARALAAVRSAHRVEPLARTAPKDVAVRALTAAGSPVELAPAVIDHLAGAGVLVAEGPGVRAPEHAVELDAGQQAAADALLAALEAAPFSPPPLGEAAEQAGAAPALVRELEAAGRIVRLGGEVAVTTDALTRAVERLRALYAAEGPFTAARAKEALATSRKFAVPLLEELDRRGHTRRRGDVREIREP